MKPEDNHSEMESEQTLDRIFNEIRDEPIPPGVVEKAAERAWNSISAAGSHGIRGCEDFRAMMPGYRDGSLIKERVTKSSCRSRSRPLKGTP